MQTPQIIIWQFLPLRLRHPACPAYHFNVDSSTSKTGGPVVRCVLHIVPYTVLCIVCLLPGFTHAQTVDSVIRSLADPNASARAAAEAQLVHMGLEARPALILASRSSSPAIAAASARILMSLPWYRSTDPVAVQAILRTYGALDEAARMETISQLTRLSDLQGVPALLRLVLEDPSEDVCWKIVTHMARVAEGMALPVDNPKVQEQLRQLDPPDSRPAALTLVAHAWINVDQKKGLRMLERALQTELRQPSYDDSNLDFAFEELAANATFSHRYEDAARLWRQQTARVGVTRDAFPTPVYQLFALHARYGPLPGFEDDLLKYEAYLGHPQVMYMVAEVYQHAGRNIEALACRQAAMASSLLVLSRAQVAGFLAMTGCTDLARREYRALALADESYIRIEERDAALRYLAGMASRDDADAVAIDYFDRLRDLISQPGISWRDGKDRQQEFINLYTAEILWRQARVALSKGQNGEANAHFDELMALGPTDTDVIQNSYPLLISLNRKEDADKLFGIGYARLRASLDAAPNAPVWWNDLAWLSARCDQKLDEALDLSKRAVAAEPNTASYIDTLAEVQFRKGNAAEAVRLETRALELEPGDVFMLRQLDRFKAGVK